MSTRLHADGLVTSPAERACLAALRDVAGESDGPMERHCLRVFVIAERIAAVHERSLDREAVLCAGLLHDVGIYPGAAADATYTRDGRDFAERLLAPFDWAPGRLALCLDAIEHHHARTPRWRLGAEVECVRRADLVDVSGGTIRLGVPGGWLRGLFSSVPRRGMYPEIARYATRRFIERPGSMLGAFEK